MLRQDLTVRMKESETNNAILIFMEIICTKLDQKFTFEILLETSLYRYMSLSTMTMMNANIAIKCNIGKQVIITERVT